MDTCGEEGFPVRFFDEIVQAAALRERTNLVIMIHIVHYGDNACNSIFLNSRISGQFSTFHPFNLQFAV